MLCELNPLTDPRWPAFLHDRPDASVFHTSAWLQALQSTYGYEPVVVTTAKPGEPLTDGLAFCQVNSWLTGNRLLSLPFSDSCEPLARSQADLQELFEQLEPWAKARQCDYVEVRPETPLPNLSWSGTVSQQFCYHRLDLRPGASQLFRASHRDCIQRKVHRAEREGVVIQEASDGGFLDEFYQLMVQTRQRHGVPPQPLAWFKNVLRHMAGQARIVCALQGGQAVAAVMTLTHNNTVYYKYGASDASQHRLGAMPYLFWHVIQDSTLKGLEVFDFGRSDLDNPGLIAFKERWKPERSTISYWRLAAGGPMSRMERSWSKRWVRSVVRYLPPEGLKAMGRLLHHFA